MFARPVDLRMAEPSLLPGVGCVLSVAFADHATVTHSLDDFVGYFMQLVRHTSHANRAAVGFPYAGFQTVILPGSPGYALYPSAQVALVRMDSGNTRGKPAK